MSIVEKMARVAHEAKHRGMKNVWAWGDPGLIAEHREYVDEIDAMLRAAITATGLTETQLEGLANGDLVILPNPLKARERADAVADRAMLAAKEG